MRAALSFCFSGSLSLHFIVSKVLIGYSLLIKVSSSEILSQEFVGTLRYRPNARYSLPFIFRLAQFIQSHFSPVLFRHD